MGETERVHWAEAEPARFAAEKAAMQLVAPDLAWDSTAACWEGYAPRWPFDRSPPLRLREYLAGRSFRIRVEYSEAFPMVAPFIWPLDPRPDPRYWTDHDWHLNGDGTLCLLQSASDWDGVGTAGDLVAKASGWFLEHLLMEDGRIEHMAIHGIANDPVFDLLLTDTEPES
jgi:hypothetical protein